MCSLWRFVIARGTVIVEFRLGGDNCLAAPRRGARSTTEILMMTPEARAALLQAVTHAGFVPPQSETLLVEETRLRGEVDDFAASFFATPVEARRQRWQALSVRCASSPPLSARLAALEPGLGLDLRPGDIGNPRTAQLASHVAGLFVLAPVARAAQRQAVLRAMHSDIAGWEECARQLQATAPTLSALEPTLVTSILNWRQQQQQLARLRQGRPAPTYRPPSRTTTPTRAPAPAPVRSGGKAFGWVGVAVAIGIVRVCIGLGSHSTSPAPQPRIEIPRIDPDQAERTRRLMEDLERIQRNNPQIEDPNKQHGAQPGGNAPRDRGAQGPAAPPRDGKDPAPRPAPR
jgi:hypothetical protein